MKVSLEWLKRYVDIPEDPHKLAEDLTMFGLNVESVEKTGEEFTGVVFGKVLECRKHPGADRLTVCRVDAGQERPLDIVCGAPNVRAGLSVPVALSGAVLKGGLKIKRTKLRGEVSEGMICSETELGTGEDSSGIIELDLDLEPGTDLSGKLGRSDYILDIEVTPNRPDQLSHIGIAREVAALYGRELREPGRFRLETGADYRIEIENGSDCPRYSAAFVEDVKAGPSPLWMQELLIAAGVRPVSNIVDVTNFVLLETGQPLHAFDRAKMRSDSIKVRRGRKGETIRTLDGTSRQAEEDVLLITDGEEPIGVAGVMGGLDTEVDDVTASILIESATFDPRAVRSSTRALKLDTEASYRFERESDPGATLAALERACFLIEEIGAGRPLAGCADVKVDDYAAKGGTVKLRVSQANRLMGTMLASDDLVELLGRLGLDAADSGDSVEVSVPSFRRDIKEEVDLIEEAARVYGYDRIGREEDRRVSLFGEESYRDARNDRLCERFASRGFAQVITTSFMDPEDPARFEWGNNDPRGGPVLLSNPLTASQSAMRTSLLPGMIRVIQKNTPAEREGIRIFELAKVFLKAGEGEGLPEESLRLTAMFSRKSAPPQWLEPGRTFDFFDMKGEAESAIEYLGSEEPVSIEKVGNPGEDYIFEIRTGKSVAGTCGMIPSRVLERYEIEEPVYYFDLDVDVVWSGSAERTLFSPPSQYPAVKRDLSVSAPEKATFSDIRNYIRKRAKHLESIKLFDYYLGERLEEGRRGYTFRLTFRSMEGTLDDEAVDGSIRKVLAGLRDDLQVTLRSL